MKPCKRGHLGLRYKNGACAKCRRIANQRYRLAHPDRVKESANRYAEKVNALKRKCRRCGASKPKQHGRQYCVTCSSILARETARNSAKRSYQKHRERWQQYRRENPEKIRTWKRISYLRHRQRILKQQNHYRETKREWINARRRGGALWFWNFPQIRQCQICSAMFLVNRNVKTCSIECCKKADRLSRNDYRAAHPEMTKQYYQNNRAIILEKNKEYRNKNYHKLMAQWREKYKANRETIRRRARELRNSNPAYFRWKANEYRRRNRDKINAAKRASYYRNHDKYIAYQQKQRSNPSFRAMKSVQDKVWRERNYERKRQHDQAFRRPYSIALKIVRNLGIKLPIKGYDRTIAAMQIVRELGLNLTGENKWKQI